MSRFEKLNLNLSVIRPENADILKTVGSKLRIVMDIVVLALIASKPMCGTDILDRIHRNKPAKGSEADIKRMLEEHSSANEFLNDFLKSQSLGVKMP